MLIFNYTPWMMFCLFKLKSKYFTKKLFSYFLQLLPYGMHYVGTFQIQFNLIFFNSLMV